MSTSSFITFGKHPMTFKTFVSCAVRKTGMLVLIAIANKNWMYKLTLRSSPLIQSDPFFHLPFFLLRITPEDKRCFPNVARLETDALLFPPGPKNCNGTRSLLTRRRELPLESERASDREKLSSKSLWRSAYFSARWHLR